MNEKLTKNNDTSNSIRMRWLTRITVYTNIFAVVIVVLLLGATKITNLSGPPTPVERAFIR